MPGLIDCHVHLGTVHEDRPDLGAAREVPQATRFAEAAIWAEATLRAGFTTVRDLGGPHRINIELARAVRADSVCGVAGNCQQLCNGMHACSAAGDGGVTLKCTSLGTGVSVCK